MPEAINSCTFTGNVVRDAELVRSNGGTAILKFSLAVPGSRRDPATGAWADWPNFLDMKLFGPRAEALAGRLSRGQRIAVRCEARYARWEDKATGSNRSRIEFDVKDLVFLGRREAPAEPEMADHDISF